jgi:hypothetical protein
LPGRYISYKRYLKEHSKLLFGVPDDHDEDLNSKGASTPRIVEEEISEPEEDLDLSSKDGDTTQSDDRDGYSPSPKRETSFSLALRQLCDLRRMEDLSRTD